MQIPKQQSFLTSELAQMFPDSFTENIPFTSIPFEHLQQGSQLPVFIICIETRYHIQDFQFHLQIAKSLSVQLYVTSTQLARKKAQYSVPGYFLLMLLFLSLWGFCSINLILQRLESSRCNIPLIYTVTINLQKQLKLPFSKDSYGI